MSRQDLPLSPKSIDASVSLSALRFLKNAESCNAACNYVQATIIDRVFSTSIYTSVSQMLNVAIFSKTSICKYRANHILETTGEVYPWVKDIGGYLHILQGEAFVHINEPLTVRKAVERMVEAVREQHDQACPTKELFAEWLIENCVVPLSSSTPSSPTVNATPHESPFSPPRDQPMSVLMWLPPSPPQSDSSSPSSSNGLPDNQVIPVQEQSKLLVPVLPRWSSFPPASPPVRSGGDQNSQILDRLRSDSFSNQLTLSSFLPPSPILSLPLTPPSLASTTTSINTEDALKPTDSPSSPCPKKRRRFSGLTDLFVGKSDEDTTPKSPTAKTTHKTPPTSPKPSLPLSSLLNRDKHGV